MVRCTNFTTVPWLFSNDDIRFFIFPVRPLRWYPHPELGSNLANRFIPVFVYTVCAFRMTDWGMDRNLMPDCVLLSSLFPILVADVFDSRKVMKVINHDQFTIGFFSFSTNPSIECRLIIVFWKNMPAAHFSYSVSPRIFQSHTSRCESFPE